MEALINQLVKALGWSILHSLWQGAIVYALLFILITVLSKASAKLKHNIALAGLGLIFISFCYTFNAVFEWPSHKVNQTVLANHATLLQLYNNKPSFIQMAEAYFPTLSIVYVIGITFQLAILVISYFKLKKLKKDQVKAIPNHWNSIFEQTLKTLSIKKQVQFFLSAKVNVPLVIGFFKPVVLFPIAIASQLEINQVEAILIHELSHIRRNDYLINLVKTVIETLMFFNPFVWLTTKLIHIEREHACDDLVVHTTGTPVTYAHALLKLELLKEKQTPALSLAATGNQQHLYQRIKRITNMKTNYINVKQQALILTLAFTTILSLAWINPSKKTVIKKEKAKSVINKTITNKIVINADTDTVKTKVKKEQKVKIVITDLDGKEKVYHSVKEMPDSLKNNFKFKLSDDSLFLSKFVFTESPEFVLKMEKMGKDLEAKFNSPEWKDKIAKIEFNGKKLDEKFNSMEWKDKIAKIEFNGKKLDEKFNSMEWKKHTDDWKKQAEDMKKLRESPEYKKLREKYEKDIEKLKKKNGIKTDKAFLLMDENIPVQTAFLPNDPTKPLSFGLATTFEPAVGIANNINVKALPAIAISSSNVISLNTGNEKPLIVIKPAKVDSTTETKNQ